LATHIAIELEIEDGEFYKENPELPERWQPE
jgi:hypothetical protein